MFVKKNGRPLSFFVYAKQTQSGFESGTRGYCVSTLTAAHDEYLEISREHPYRLKQNYNEYLVNAQNPYFMMSVPKDFTAREIADSLYASGVLNRYEYNSILTKSGIDERGYKGIAAKNINKELLKQGIDSIVYMNGTYDRGSMGVMVFDKDQLIPISQNGVPDENFVENAGKNEIDSLENNGYNEVGRIKNPYNNDESNIFQSYISSIRSGELTPLVDFEMYKKVSEQIDIDIVGITTSNGIVISGKSNHCIARIIGSVEQKRDGVSVYNVLDALTNKNSKIFPIKTFNNGRSQKFRYANVEVSVNPDTGKVIQVNPYIRRKK